MKTKAIFCEFWFKKDDKTWYKVHFQLSADRTAFVPSDHPVNVGDDIVLALGRDKDGRCKVTLAR